MNGSCWMVWQRSGRKWWPLYTTARRTKSLAIDSVTRDRVAWRVLVKRGEMACLKTTLAAHGPEEAE